MATDEQLMVAYASGDQSAFRELFRRYAPVLQRVMRHQLFRADDADDLVQQTFLQLHRSRHDFKAEYRLRPWVFTIALNLKREYFRRVGRRPEVLTEPEAVAEHLPGSSGHGRTEAAQAVEYALRQLPEDQREVIALHWLADIPLPEVAGLVGASLSAVKVRAHRGYAAMRKALAAGNPKDV